VPIQGRFIVKLDYIQGRPVKINLRAPLLIDYVLCALSNTGSDPEQRAIYNHGQRAQAINRDAPG